MENDLFLKALRGQNEDSRPPVWLMRQAGRYMPQYRAIREKHSFLEMCRQPELAAEVTLLPIDLLGTDAAILFADILLILDAMGRGLRFEEGIGPVIERPADPGETFGKIDVKGNLGYVAEAIRLLKPQLKVPLIGFAGAPFTVASYLIEGRSSRDLKKTKIWMRRDPRGFHQLLEVITEATIAYLKMQADAGVQALQLFDSWANALSFPHFHEFGLQYHKRIIDALDLPVILFCRGSSTFATAMASIKPAAISVDWNAWLPHLRLLIPQTIALQGNLDPHVLYAPREAMLKEVRQHVAGMKGDPAYICNLGHGLLPDMDLDAVRALVDAVKES